MGAKTGVLIVSRKTKVLCPDSSTTVYLVPTTKESCFFVVDCDDRTDAYRFLSLLRGFYEVFFGLSPWSIDELNMSIYEFDRMPRLSWTETEWFQNYRRFDTGTADNLFEVFAPRLSKTDFTIGLEFFVDGEFDDFRTFVVEHWGDPQMIGVLDDLNLSLKVFDGNILNEFPDYRFRDNPQSLPTEVIDKSYLEFRGKFELAFLCAFKGLERYFGVNQIAKKHIVELFAANNVDPSGTYKPRYLSLLGLEVEPTNAGCLRHLIDVRNAAAAHSNKNPPWEKRVSIYAVYEIQEYLRSMLLRRLDLGT